MNQNNAKIIWGNFTNVYKPWKNTWKSSAFVQNCSYAFVNSRIFYRPQRAKLIRVVKFLIHVCHAQKLQSSYGLENSWRPWKKIEDASLNLLAAR